MVVAAGAGTLVAEVIAVTLLQRAAPPDVTARVFGVYDQLNVGAIAVGSLLAGPLADRARRIEASIIVVALAACLLAAVFAVCGSVAVRGTRWARGTGPERRTRFRWSRSCRADVSKEFFAKQRSGTLRRATASSVSASLSSRHAMTTQIKRAGRHNSCGDMNPPPQRDDALANWCYTTLQEAMRFRAPA